MKHFTKLLSFTIIFFATIFLTSCVDVVNSITISKNTYIINYKFTISKSLLAFSGMEKEDAINEINMMKSQLSKDIIIDEVDTDFEIGFIFNMKIPMNTTDQNLQSLLPIQIGKNYIFPISFINSFDFATMYDTESDSGAITMAILSSAKYRLLLSKTMISNIRRVYIQNYDLQYDLDLYDYGDMYCVEVPAIMFINPEYKVDKIIFEQR